MALQSVFLKLGYYPVWIRVFVYEAPRRCPSWKAVENETPPRYDFDFKVFDFWFLKKHMRKAKRAVLIKSGRDVDRPYRRAYFLLALLPLAIACFFIVYG